MDGSTRTCCYRAALDPEALFCGECGSHLVRCAAFDECSSLLDSHGLCPVCVSLDVQLDAAAVRGVQIGGVLSLPLLLSNTSQVGRPLFVSSLMVRRGGGEYQPVPLSWEKLDPGRASRVGVPTGVLEEAGVHQFDFLITVGTRYRWREERYAFETSVTADVSAPKAQAVVNQTIQIDGDMAPGFTFYNPTRVGAAEPAKWDETSGPMPLTLQRAERYERESGMRGLNGKVSIPRSTRMVWTGFGKGEAPEMGPVFNQSGSLNVGRSRTRQANGPNDVRLLVHGPDGAVDETLSAQVSRHHFDLYIENDRLVVRVESPNGLRVNDEAYGRGKTIALRHGDTISPLIHQRNALKLSVAMEVHFGSAETITITRQA
ncbi:MAG: FHA domain-containing protein [Pseudomonadota bacterium]